MQFMLPEDRKWLGIDRTIAKNTGMPDHILIHDLLLRTIVGINPDERENKQDVLINLKIETDLRKSGRSDQIGDTLNYRTLCKQVIERVESSTFLLVESLAEEIANVCLADALVVRVQVTVEKPGALRFARSVGVVIERSRDE